MKNDRTKKLTGYTRFMTLTPAERDAEVAPFNEELIAVRVGRKPSAETQKKLQRIIKRGRGRPKVGEGVKRVLVSVERSLLARADAAAKRRKISRAELVAEGLQMALAKS
jgi:predicted HicB family RNase H-like nuclease